MKGTLVVLLCATVARCIDRNFAEYPEYTLRPPRQISTENTVDTKISAVGSHAQDVDAGVIQHQSGVNPFLPAAASHHRKLTGSGQSINHQSGEKPVIGSRRVHQDVLTDPENRRNPFLQGSSKILGNGRVNLVDHPGVGFVNQKSVEKSGFGSQLVQGVHHEAGGNPFLQGNQQNLIPSGGQQSGVTSGPVVPQIQVPSGFGNQQLGVVQPVGSHVQTTGGGFGNQQPGPNPFLQGSPDHHHHQIPNHQVSQQSGVQPIGSHVQTTGGGFVNQQPGPNPFLQGSPDHHHHQTPNHQVSQQSGVQPVGSYVQSTGGGFVNQQPGPNPFLQGSSDHHHHHQTPNHQVGQQLGVQSIGSHIQPPKLSSNVEVVDQPTVVNPFLQGSPASVHHQHHSHEVPSRIQQRSSQQLAVQRSASHVRHQPTDGEVVTQQPEVQTANEHHQVPIATERPADVVGIIMQDSEVNPDGTYHNVWESENGIKVQEEGTVRNDGEVAIHAVSGSIAYTDADGNPIVLTYTADENGFHPHGDHLPTPPPIPQSVARALEYIAAHPYDEEKNTEDPKKTYTLVKEELPVVEVN